MDGGKFGGAEARRIEIQSEGGRTGSEEVWKGERESERVMRVSSRLFVLQRLLWIQMD